MKDAGGFAGALHGFFGGPADAGHVAHLAGAAGVGLAVDVELGAGNGGDAGPVGLALDAFLVEPLVAEDVEHHGAEKLLGKGDMLFYPSGYQKPQRVQGAFVSDNEVSDVVGFLKQEGLTAEYSAEVESKIRSTAMDAGFGGGGRDAYFAQAGKFIIEKDKASIGMLQRMFKIGFNRAARIMDQLADAGVVGEEEGTKPRKVLMSMEQFENMMEEGY